MSAPRNQDQWVTKVLVSIVATLIGAVGASAAMYLAVVGEYVSRDEVRRLIASEAPYNLDRKWLGEKLESITHRLDRTETKVDELLRRVP